MATRSLFTFTGSPPSGKYGPRTGRIHLDRHDGSPVIHTDTPALITTTSRGVVPHLSRDNVHLTQAIRHLQLPFESFLDRNPPVLTLVGGAHPLHTFLGFNPGNHVVILTLRDPSDGRKMPPNGHDFVSAQCTRGVRKVNLPAWKTYFTQCKPDFVVTLSDTPFTPAPHSQKRLTKSIERSIAWLADFLRVSPTDPSPTRPRNVLVHLAGGMEPSARAEFAERLSEPVEQKDAPGLSPPLNTLDDGVAGYVFDLLPLHTALQASRTYGRPPSNNELLHASDRQRSSPETSTELAKLFRASLDPLPADKPRIVNSPVSPHEILRLVRDVGIDLVDGSWAQRAADIGIALDFCFPAPHPPTSESSPNSAPPPLTRKNGKLDLGHNLFDQLYRHDHARLASSFLDGKSAEQTQLPLSTSSISQPACPCHACSPHSPASRMHYSAVDAHAWADVAPSALQPPFVRAYVHHLLHTHEMSAHSLLAMHNLSVFAAFLSGIRDVLTRGDLCEFGRELAQFEETYDEGMALWDEAGSMWLEVEHARGKGRLAREKEKQAALTIGTAADL